MAHVSTQYTYNWNNIALCFAAMEASYDASEECWKFTAKTLKNYNETVTFNRIRWYFPTPSDLSTIIITRNEVIE